MLLHNTAHWLGENDRYGDGCAGQRTSICARSSTSLATDS